MENRKLNFEVLRILSMVMITSFHYCIHGNSEMIFSSKFSINQVLSYIIGSWGIVGVTCFFMISSWFLIEQKRFSAKNWIIEFISVGRCILLKSNLFVKF